MNYEPFFGYFISYHEPSEETPHELEIIYFSRCLVTLEMIRGGPRLARP